MSYTPHTDETIKEMLDVIGVSSINELFRDIPEDLFTDSFEIPEALSEFETVNHMKNLASKNRSEMICFSGGGFYDHYIPAAVDYLSSKGEFFTAYTPYQPEASQGTLQALYEYQSAVCELTGMDVSNASLYDGGTAIAEAILMAVRVTKRHSIIIDKGVNPLYRKIVKTALRHRDIELIEIEIDSTQSSYTHIISAISEKTAAVVIENPNFLGELQDFSEISEKVHSVKALMIASVYPVSLGMVKSPAEMGADIVTAEGQSLGNYLNFGGPYLGIIACRKKLMRNLPGRICGKTTDTDGKDAYVLTLQAREQHIRREKAMSNICSNQSLCALRTLIFLSLLGNTGLLELAESNRAQALKLKQQLSSLNGITINTRNFFNSFTISLPKSAQTIHENLLKENIVFGIPLSHFDYNFQNADKMLVVTATEKRTDKEINELAEKLQKLI